MTFFLGNDYFLAKQQKMNNPKYPKKEAAENVFWCILTSRIALFSFSLCFVLVTLLSC